MRNSVCDCGATTIIDFDSLQDSTDITTRGYSPVLGSLDGNSDSEKFMDFLLSKKILLAIENSKLVWNIEEAESWTSNIYTATLLLFVLIHVTQGPRITRSNHRRDLHADLQHLVRTSTLVCSQRLCHSCDLVELLERCTNIRQIQGNSTCHALPGCKVTFYASPNHQTG